MNAKTYLLCYFALSLLCAAMALGLNYLVDPYAITGAKRFVGFNFYKADINNYVGLSKKYQPLLRQHDALIVGNSRVEIGINPGHHCFALNDWEVYNLGMPGASVRGQLVSALNVMYQQPIENVLLSVDFVDFLASQRVRKKARAMALLSSGELGYLPSGTPNPDYLQVRLLDYYKSLFSLDSLVSSIKTIGLQSGDAADRDTAGFNPARDFAHSVRLEGPAALFDQKLQELDQKYSSPRYLRDSSGELGYPFYDIKDFLAIAAKRKVKVILFTNPFHETYWSLMAKQDLMPLYLDWIESLEEMVSAHNSDLVALWNFSGDSPYIHEEVPTAGVKTEPLNWFWEPAHYRMELGDLMIDTMFSGSCDTDEVFGEKLF